MLKCWRIEGIVQGVGFRPFVRHLATSLFLCGAVWNEGADVVLLAEGSEDVLGVLIKRLRSEMPPLARIESICEIQAANPVPQSGAFVIADSKASENHHVRISPDMTVCDACLSEMRNPVDRRYGYPMINCTHCGPRFTIIKGVPYDRIKTTMDVFPMCPECQKEYADPENRRFHAQPVSCHHCGPVYQLLLKDGRPSDAVNPFNEAAVRLGRGEILAVKGLGGYHLVCDARNSQSVRELRRLKHRDRKPFAMMAADEDEVQRICEVSSSEQQVLKSRERPVVLLSKKHSEALCEEIAPGNSRYGVMLPYLPAQYLLFDCAKRLGIPLPLLVMTSGNLSGEPIAYKDDEAFSRLQAIADAFLVHDREIHIRTDDSVVQVVADDISMVRRSRGYVPAAISVSLPADACVPDILAVGAQLKHTFCMLKGYQATMSHHIGDLENPETMDAFESGVRHFSELLEVSPSLIVRDMHPDYLSSVYAGNSGHQVVTVQHHHAHIAAVCCENGWAEPVIGLAYDGTGYGEDGTIWGGECFTGLPWQLVRSASVETFRLPGGEKAAREPWRVAVGLLERYAPDFLDTFEPEGISRRDIQTLLRAADRGVNAPVCSSMGRLFDALASLCGAGYHSEFEADVAMRLEAMAGKQQGKTWPFEKKEGTVTTFCAAPLIQGIMNDKLSGRIPEALAADVHDSLVALAVEMVRDAEAKTGIRAVALSGGVFSNIRLTELLIRQLEQKKYKVIRHRNIPCNDGGIALGQAWTAAWRYKRR